MNTTRYFRSETVKVLRNRKVVLRAAALAFAVAAAIDVASGPASAQDQSRLEGLLNAIAASAKVSPRVSLPLQVGFFNGQPTFYITPEVGVDPSAGPSVIATAKQIATGFNANFIPQNFATLPGSPTVDDILVFSNFTQGNVLASAPHPAGPNNTDVNYSQLWQVNLVTFNPGRQGRVLNSQSAILGAAAAGEVTIKRPGIIVECSVIFTPEGGLLPGARVTGGRAETK